MSSQSQPFARTDRTTLSLWWWTTDRFLLAAIALLICVGVALSFGASPAAALRTQDAVVGAASLALVMRGTFGLGCAASNIHDVAWCAAITDNFTKHFAAGFDLDYFVAFGNKFGISREVLADYATLGPCAFVMVAGELAVAAACFLRLSKLSENG